MDKKNPGYGDFYKQNANFLHFPEFCILHLNYIAESHAADRPLSGEFGTFYLHN